MAVILFNSAILYFKLYYLKILNCKPFTEILYEINRLNRLYYFQVYAFTSIRTEVIYTIK